MTCDEIRPLIHEAHDDGRVDALPEPARAHLAACGACREVADDLLRLSQALRAMPRIPLPAEALDAVWRETVGAKPRALRTSKTSFGIWRLAAAASFVAALSTATLYLVFKPAAPAEPSARELARASAQADIVFGYTARALAAARNAATDKVIASRVSPAVRGAAASPPSRRP